MTTRADQLGKRLETVGTNINRLSSNLELGKIVIWFFSIEALLKEGVRFYADLVTVSDYKKLPAGILTKPTFSRSRKAAKKFPNKTRLYYKEIDSATFGMLIEWYKTFRPSNRKLGWKLDKIRKGRNKIVHQLLRSKDVDADLYKLLPKSIAGKPMRDVLNDILTDMRDVLDEISKI
jgi:hypothetical protein